MVYKPRRERARGGKAEDTEPLHPEHGNKYNAVGSPEAKEEDAKSDGFKRGGMAKKKKKDGGHVEGGMARHHLGKMRRGGMTEEKKMEDHTAEDRPMERARGGRTDKPMARGGSPFSSAHKTVGPVDTKMKDGPGEQAPIIP
jgi:hypothetical protein